MLVNGRWAKLKKLKVHIKDKFLKGEFVVLGSSFHCDVCTNKKAL